MSAVLVREWEEVERRREDWSVEVRKEEGGGGRNTRTYEDSEKVSLRRGTCIAGVWPVLQWYVGMGGKVTGRLRGNRCRSLEAARGRG